VAGARKRKQGLVEAYDGSGNQIMQSTTLLGEDMVIISNQNQAVSAPEIIICGNPLLIAEVSML